MLYDMWNTRLQIFPKPLYICIIKNFSFTKESIDAHEANEMHPVFQTISSNQEEVYMEINMLSSGDSTLDVITKDR